MCRCCAQSQCFESSPPAIAAAARAPAGVQCIRQEWTAKDGQAAQQLIQQLQDLAAQQGHALTHTDAVGNTVIAELTTAPKGEGVWGVLPPAAAAVAAALRLLMCCVGCCCRWFDGE